jgi:poly-gamma-glutamate synthesis protein (capsule biosynthesis protein)
VAAGDVLTHDPVNQSAKSTGVLDYSPLMANMAPYVSGADIAICHLEVPVAPAGTAPSGYPMFGAPKEIVRDLGELGWDGCSTASNHSVDRKFAGIVATIEELDAYRMGYAGTARSAEEAASVQFYHVREGNRVIKVADISFAYGLNGLPIPAEAPWSVNIFNADAADASPIIAAAQQARDQGADVVIASVHCCVEYRTAPTPAQRAVVEQIAASGLVDLYVGHHGHVPQPIELLAGGPNGDGMWAAFGLGNFLSNQDTQCCVAETNSGVLLSAQFTVDPEDKVTVGVEWSAFTVDRLGKHTMYLLRDIPGGAGRLSAAEVQARLSRVAGAVGPQAPERTTPLGKLADAAYVVPRGPWTPGS